MTNILVVCHGNKFRSPLCWAVLHNLLPKEQFTVDSAGIKPQRIGGPAAKPVREFAAEHLQLDLSKHEAKQVDAMMLVWADVVIYMDQGNLRGLRSVLDGMNPDLYPKLINLGSFVNKTRIPDPAYERYASRQFRGILDLVAGASLIAAQEWLRKAP